MTANPVTAAGAQILLRRDRAGVATLTLNRPQALNALSTPLLAALQKALDEIGGDTSVRVVVLAAEGKAFCAGHDLHEMRADPSPEAMQALFRRCAHMMTSLTRLPQPVIARVHADAAAAGCQLVAQCDLAVAADSARFGTSGVNIGLFCSTPMVAVTRNLPRKQAMELLLTGEMIDARTAVSLGLINRSAPAHELDGAVDELARAVAAKAPAAVALGKELFYRQIEEGLEAAYARASEAITCNMQFAETREGIDAFLDRRPMPAWPDRD